MNNLVLGTNLHNTECFECPTDSGIVYLGFTEATCRGSLPVRVEISQRGIDIKVYPRRVKSAWTVAKGYKPEHRRYEIVVSEELQLSQWDMDGTPQLRGRRITAFDSGVSTVTGKPRNWDIGQEKDARWEIEYIHNQRVAVECLGDLSSAVAWLSREAEKLTDPTSTYRTIAAQLAKKRALERTRQEFESGTRQRNRACVLDDCYREISRAYQELKPSLGREAVQHLTHKQDVSFRAGIYGAAMGESGWLRTIEDGVNFSAGDAAAYEESTEFNTRHGGGILHNMWNAVAESRQQRIIDTARQLIETVDMKAVHDASVKKWFQLALETEAHAEGAKRAEGAAYRVRWQK